MNIALISPNYNAVSETFIKNHKENLPGKIYYYYGGLIPTSLEGYGNFKKQYNTSIFNRFCRKFLNIKKDDDLFFEESLIKNKIDLVFAEFGNTGGKIYPICKRLNIPLVVVWHGYEISIDDVITSNKKAYENMLRDSNIKHIIVSNTMKSKLEEFGALKRNIFYSPMPPNDKFRKITPNLSSKNLLAVGRLVEKKAPYYLILAMNKIVKIHKDVKLIIIGDGPLFNVCNNLISYYNLQDNIKMLGALSHNDIIKYFENSSIFIQHSITAMNGDQEGTPVSILEASLANLPIVSTNHSGISEIVLNDKTGYLVEEHDIDSFTDKIILLLNNVEKRDELGKLGREYIIKKYSLDIHLEIINNIIKSYQIG